MDNPQFENNTNLDTDIVTKTEHDTPLLHTGKFEGSLQELPAIPPKPGDPTLKEYWDEKDPETQEFIAKVPSDAAEITPKKSHRRLIIGGSAVAAFGAGTAIVINAILGGAGQAGTNPPKSDPITGGGVESSAPVDPSDTGNTSEVNVDVTQIPEDVIEYNLFETLSSDKQAEILSMKNMSVAEFRALPRPAQLRFAYFVYDNNIDVTKYRLEATGQSSVFEDANLETPRGLRNNEDLKYAVLVSLKTNTPEAIAIDTDTALKASVFLYDEGSEVAQKAYDDEINTWNLNTVANIRKVAFTGSKTLENGDIVSNETDSNTQTAYQNTYRVVDVELINGETRKDSALVLSVTANDPRYIPDIQQ